MAENSKRRRNEGTSMFRQEPFAYAAKYDASFNVINEAWAEPGTAFTDAEWVVCEHTYDANNSLTRTQWAKDSGNKHARFTNAIGSDNTTADLIDSFTFE